MAENILKNTQFGPDLIQLGIDAVDTKDALDKTSQALYALDLVEPTFLEALWKREQEYPTGLPGESIGFAMPHTDSDQVKKQAISIAVLKNPVKFRVMGTETDEVDVTIIFMLAIKKSEDQLQFLQALMALFQNQKTMEKLIGSQSKEEIYEIFTKFINEECIQ